MRLYVSNKEVAPLKKALKEALHKDTANQGLIKAVYDRVILCEELQNNERKSKNLDAV